MQTVQPRAILNRFRRYPRVRALTPFTCSLTRLAGSGWFRKSRHHIGVIYDLSLRGLRMSTEASIELGDEISMILRLPNQAAPVEISVATVRWAKDHIYGLAFRNLSESARGRMRKYMTLTAQTESHGGGLKCTE
jgi:hypothetical protein